MKSWFLRFSLREQIALLTMLFAIAAYLFVMLLILPQSRARAEMAERNMATAEALQRIDAMASEIRALRARGAQSSPGNRPGLSAFLNDSALRYDLQISRLQPNSRGAVQLRFETASLEALLRWIHHLESAENLVVEELSMSQTSSAGIVSATLRIAGTA